MGLFDTDPRAARIIRSLREDAANWTDGRFVARHASGVCLWVANEVYGLGVGVGDASPYDGALDAWSRRRVWKAYRQWRANLRSSDSIIGLLDGTHTAETVLDQAEAR